MKRIEIVLQPVIRLSHNHITPYIAGGKGQLRLKAHYGVQSKQYNWGYGRALIILILIGIFIITTLSFYSAEYLSRQAASGVQTPLIRIFPVAGVLGQDLRDIVSHFDHDPEPATIFSDAGLGKNNVKDYNGGDKAYDGHQGTDIGIVSFEYQDIGVPVVAVEKGVVKELLDGVFDRELSLNGKQGNYIIVDHGGGFESYYNHLQKGSISVKKGQTVFPGEQIARLGSSGNSTWPHLHFEWKINGKSVDPFSGPGNPGQSWFEQQPDYDQPMTIVDWGLAYKQDLTEPPLTHSRENCAVPGKSKDMYLKLWIQIINIRDEPFTMTWKLVSPCGGYTNNWSKKIDGSESWHGIGKTQWRYTYNFQFSEKASLGIWKIYIYIEDILMKELHVSVSKEKINNRPPLPPPGLQLEPASPEFEKAVTCTVKPSPVNLDPDMDKERFRFEWLLNGNIVRNATNATRRDYFPAGLAKAGDTLVCRVYTSDGSLESLPVTGEITYIKIMRKKDF